MSNKVKPIACQVRIENGKPILFYWEVFTRENKQFPVLCCFTWEDGHNTASVEYMRSLPLMPEDVASKEVSRHNFNYFDDTPEVFMRLVKRLVKPKI